MIIPSSFLSEDAGKLAILPREAIATVSDISNRKLPDLEDTHFFITEADVMKSGHLPAPTTCQHRSLRDSTPGVKKASATVKYQHRKKAVST